MHFSKQLLRYSFLYLQMDKDYLKQMTECFRENIATRSFSSDPILLRLNLIRNKYLDEDVLELHGLSRKLAIQVLKKRVDEIKGEFF